MVKEITSYIKLTYDISYTPEGLVPVPHKLGFSFKKVKLVPAKANLEAQEAFLVSYKRLRKKPRRKEPVIFIDACHPTHNVIDSQGWFETRTEHEVKSSLESQRINLHGAYNLAIRETIVKQYDTINAETTIEFFKEIEKKYPDSQNVHIILDNGKYYHAKRVREYLENSEIVLHFLPSYSPNLNLIERLWKFFKKKILYNTYYERFSEFKAAVEQFFDVDIGRLKQELKSLMREKFRLVAA